VIDAEQNRNSDRPLVTLLDNRDAVLCQLPSLCRGCEVAADIMTDAPRTPELWVSCLFLGRRSRDAAWARADRLPLAEVGDDR
jgi:hypothetical protein